MKIIHQEFEPRQHAVAVNEERPVSTPLRKTRFRFSQNALDSRLFHAL
jgi:hypothetical protein